MTSKETSQVIKCARIGLTDIQSSFMMGVSVDRITGKYEDIIKDNLPPDYMERRWKRLVRYDPVEATRLGKIYRKENCKTPISRVKSAMANQVSIHCNKRGIERRGKAFKLFKFNACELKTHLELMFKPWMTWDNYGTMWEIDHKIPVSWFSFNSVDDKSFHVCWGLDNLQPLPKVENIRKGGRWCNV